MWKRKWKIPTSLLDPLYMVSWEKWKLTFLPFWGGDARFICPTNDKCESKSEKFPTVYLIPCTWCHEKSESWHFYLSEVAMHGSFVPLMTNIKAKVKNSQQCARSLTWCHEKSESWHFDHSTLSIFRFYIYKVNIPEIRSTYQK